MGDTPFQIDPAKVKPMRVLVCDDDPDVGGFLTTLFDLEGWTTHLVKSGEDCLSTIAEFGEPDALVLDQVMPGLTGVQTARKLRREGFERPIVLCSGHLGPELNGAINRLKLLPCNKIDLTSLVRIVRAAVEVPAARSGS
jgi:CheY-like chemotaxis protein